MKRVATILIISMIIMLFVSATALAAWPSSDQYSAVNAAMQSAVAGAGISPDTFISIYNAAAAGNVTGFSSSQISAACQVLNSLSAYKSSLPDYTTVYNNLGCSSVAASNPGSSSLPSTGVAMGLLIASGLVGLGAASMLIRRARHQ